MAAKTARAKLTNLKTLVSPDGIAAYPRLTKPHDPFGKGDRFEITVFFDKTDTNYTNFAKVLAELQHKFRSDIGKVLGRSKKRAPATCIKVADEKMVKKLGVELGQPYIQFVTKPQQDDNGNVIPIPVIGPDGRRIRKPVYGTDLVAVEGNVVGWETSQGTGLKIYLGAVQILQSNWRKEAGAGFGVRDEYVKDDEDENIDAPDEAGLEEEDIDLEDEEDEDLDVVDDDPAGGMV